MKTYEWVAVPDGIEEFILEKIRNDEYEQRQLDLVRRFATKRHRVLEGGSGLGIVTQALTERVSFTVSCEANWEMVQCAKQNAPDAEMVYGALAPSSWWVADTHTGSAFGVDAFQPPFHVGADYLIAEHRLNALVLDIEGMEADLLFSIDLDPIELIIVETHPDLAGKGKLAGAHARLLVEGFTILASKEDGTLRHVAYSR